MHKVFTRRTGIWLIMAMAMLSSYSTQRELFSTHGVDALTATVAPLAIDLLTAICASILAADNVTRGKGTAFIVMVLAGGGSMWANWLAGATGIAKAVHVGMVGIYLLGELVNSRVRVKVEPQAATVTATEVAEPVEVEDNAAPVRVATRGPRGPYKGRESYSRTHSARLASAE
jgi:hypothetical protein